MKSFVDWNDEKLAFILGLVEKGYTRERAAKAARSKYGEPFTKNAVIGRINRAKSGVPMRGVQVRVRRDRKVDERVLRILKMHDDGIPMWRIAQMLKMRVYVVADWINSVRDEDDKAENDKAENDKAEDDKAEMNA